jgi:hypothetical protein
MTLRVPTQLRSPRRVDAPRSAGYVAAARAGLPALAALALAALAAAGCTARNGFPDAPVSYEIARAAVAATAPAAPVRAVFDWRLQERDARFSGRGAARIEPPYRGRVDLFGPRGESVLSAAVVEGELRLPPGGTTGAVPPSPLLWSALGVVRPPDGAELTGTWQDGARTRLEYTRGGERWTFTLHDQRLRSVEWRGEGGGRQTVELRGDAPRGLPGEATFRDWAAFVELVLTLEQVTDADPFPPETWTPGG